MKSLDTNLPIQVQLKLSPSGCDPNGPCHDYQLVGTPEHRVRAHVPSRQIIPQLRRRSRSVPAR